MAADVQGVRGFERFPPLPPFTTAEELLADALPMLDATDARTVTQFAEDVVKIQNGGLWGDYSSEVTPYTAEPADITQDRRFKAVVFVGPSQSGKTAFLIAVALYGVAEDLGPVQVIHMTRPDAQAWVEDKLDPIIENSPKIHARLGKNRDDSTFSRKRFRGAKMAIGHPVANQLSSRTQRMVLLTDADHQKQKLGPAEAPEGTPYRLARNRIRTYYSRGCVLVESSPAFPRISRDFKAPGDAPHMLPPTTGGIVQIYNEGTRGRFHWECPSCGTIFEPTFERLKFDRTKPPGAAGAEAYMACPQGCVIEHKQKNLLNRRALQGRGGWLHETDTGELVGIDDPRVRTTDVASYQLNGVAAAFVSWAELVAEYLSALEDAEKLGDDTALGAFYYTSLGLPYAPRRGTLEDELTLEGLRENAVPIARGEAPSGTRFITVSVDVQKTYFAVLVTAFGAQGERWVIDRYDLTQPPSEAPRSEGRTLSPATHVEDWKVLTPLIRKPYKVVGEGFGLEPLAMTVDYQGEGGVSDKAAEWWRGRMRNGDKGRLYLTRGHGGRRLVGRTWYAAPERGSKGKKAKSVMLLNIATDRLKDTVFAAINRTDPGPGKLHLGDFLDNGAWLAEFAAEEKVGEVWKKKPGVTRNEGFDLSVQAQAVAEHKGLRQIDDWSNPPDWARADVGNARSVDLAQAAIEKPTPATPRRGKTIKYLGG